MDNGWNADLVAGFGGELHREDALLADVVASLARSGSVDGTLAGCATAVLDAVLDEVDLDAEAGVVDLRRAMARAVPLSVQQRLTSQQRARLQRAFAGALRRHGVMVRMRAHEIGSPMSRANASSVMCAAA